MVKIITVGLAVIVAGVILKKLLERMKSMAKSKLIKANEKIAEKVTDGFQKISDTVVGGYTKIEDKFVDQYLTKDGETIEQAKQRLKQEQAALKKTHL